MALLCLQHSKYTVARSTVHLFTPEEKRCPIIVEQLKYLDKQVKAKLTYDDSTLTDHDYVLYTSDTNHSLFENDMEQDRKHYPFIAEDGHNIRDADIQMSEEDTVSNEPHSPRIPDEISDEYLNVEIM